MNKKIINFSVYCTLNVFMYLMAYFFAIKPAIITATTVDYNRMKFLTILFVLTVISILYGFIMKKIIRHNSKLSHSITNESILFTFSHIFTAFIFLAIMFI
ncbi:MULTISPECIES: hypothetical protein [Bacillus]|uniref:hypothetical protein n=1 Tax=Bacillus TaxID=1386 RepID=UPI0003E1FF95|nr:hypothetical protein [Bacillus mycoides]ETT85375.1 hypothetical protein C174_02009 [Bacillus mycoides FSL H7-687]